VRILQTLHTELIGLQAVRCLLAAIVAGVTAHQNFLFVDGLLGRIGEVGGQAGRSAKRQQEEAPEDAQALV
jgi:hypothetical protein